MSIEQVGSDVYFKNLQWGGNPENEPIQISLRPGVDIDTPMQFFKTGGDEGSFPARSLRKVHDDAMESAQRIVQVFGGEGN